MLKVDFSFVLCDYGNYNTIGTWTEQFKIVHIQEGYQTIKGYNKL